MEQKAQSETASAAESVAVPQEKRPGHSASSVPSLEHLLELHGAVSPSDRSSLEAEITRFIEGDLDVRSSLKIWLGPGNSSRFEGESPAEWKRRLGNLLAFQISSIDDVISTQLNEVLHHPRFQKLESSWRGLEMLVNPASRYGDNQVRVKVIHVTWKEIQRDFERANDFDNSDLFRKIYEDEFGSPGGTPFGVLVGDYEIHPRPSKEHPFDDIAILGNIAGIAAAAFCPFVCAASPSLFGVDEFTDLERDVNLASGFQSPEFVKWRSLRKQEDARFVGLALPRILMREPYEFKASGGFCFKEDVAGNDLGKFLWGNAAWGWAQVLIRSFQESGWLADIRGTERNREGGGLLTTLPSTSFGTDRRGVAVRSSTDLVVTDQQESEFSRLGFLPLCQCHGTSFLAYYSSQSIQEPVAYSDDAATANANISAMLQYMLCVSRFAHYIKILARNKVGSFSEPEAIQGELEAWLKQYVTPDDSASQETKARRPLRQAEVSISRNPGKPGSFDCKFSLLPHYQLDELTAAIRLNTSLERLGI